MGRSSNDYDDMTSYEQFQKIETRYGSQLVELGKTVRNTSLSASDRIQAANKLLDLYNRFVAECTAAPKAVWKHFSDLYLHCHNSRNSDFVWIKQYEVMLDDLIKNREQLDARAHFLNDVLPNLPDQVMQLIKEQPGITQTELYKRFDSRLKDHNLGGSGTQALRLTALQLDGVAEQKRLFLFVLDYSIRNAKKKINRRF